MLILPWHKFTDATDSMLQKNKLFKKDILLKKTKCISLAALLILSASDMANALPQYSLTDLGSLGGTATYAYGVNATGSVVGDGYNGAGADHAFLYNGTMHDLGTLGGSSSWTSGINAAGSIVGGSYTTGYSNEHAFLYDGSMHDLGTLGGTTSGANTINDSGVIVGSATLASTGNNPAPSHAFLYDGTMHDLGTLGGTNSSANGINNSGIIAGSSQLAGDAITHAFLYNGTMHDIGTLSGSVNSSAVGINSLGQVVGFASDNSVSGGYRAFFYDGTMHALGTLGGSYSEAFAINDAGYIVGLSAISDGTTHPFLYDGTTMLDLNSLLIGNLSGVELISASGINNQDQIAAYGSNGHAYLLSISSVPVPSSIWLFGSGVLGLTGIARKRKVVK